MTRIGIQCAVCRPHHLRASAPPDLLFRCSLTFLFDVLLRLVDLLSQRLDLRIHTVNEMIERIQLMQQSRIGITRNARNGLITEEKTERSQNTTMSELAIG
jgi:hypothetical protein